MLTKEDIRVMIEWIGEAHNKDIKEVRGEVKHLGAQLDAADLVNKTMETRLSYSARRESEVQATHMRLILEDH